MLDVARDMSVGTAAELDTVLVLVVAATVLDVVLVGAPKLNA